MHPAINGEVSAGRTSDIRRQARRDTTARAAATALRVRNIDRRKPLITRTIYAADALHRRADGCPGTTMRAQRSRLMSILNDLAVCAIKPVSTARAAAAWTLIAAGVLAGCTSTATGSTSAAPTRPAVSGTRDSVATRVFSSPHYGYTMALPAGWSAQGAQQSDWPGSPGHGNDDIDVFQGPPYVAAWAFAAPSRWLPIAPSLTAYATAIARAATQLQCPATPQINQQVAIGGVAASLVGMTCPSQGGAFILAAARPLKQTNVAFVLEDTSGLRASQQADLVAFRELLTGVRFR
jgi:hypothetical protein